MYVNEVMSTPVKSCTSETSLDEIARMMWDADCGAIPVVNEANKPVGIVTDRDIAMAAMLNHRPLWELQAATVIQGQRLCCAGQQDKLDDCLTRMEQNGVRRLPVIDDGGALCGMLSLGDAVAQTQPDSRHRKAPRLSPEHVLGMLRKVSAHHQSQSGAPAPR